MRLCRQRGRGDQGACIRVSSIPALSRDGAGCRCVREYLSIVRSLDRCCYHETSFCSFRSVHHLHFFLRPFLLLRIFFGCFLFVVVLISLNSVIIFLSASSSFDWRRPSRSYSARDRCRPTRAVALSVQQDFNYRAEHIHIGKAQRR